MSDFKQTSKVISVRVAKRTIYRGDQFYEISAATNNENVFITVAGNHVNMKLDLGVDVLDVLIKDLMEISEITKKESAA